MHHGFAIHAGTFSLQETPRSSYDSTRNWLYRSVTNYGVLVALSTRGLLGNLRDDYLALWIHDSATRLEAIFGNAGANNSVVH